MVFYQNIKVNILILSKLIKMKASSICCHFDRFTLNIFISLTILTTVSLLIINDIQLSID